jgi:hypothetical protein
LLIYSSVLHRLRLSNQNKLFNFSLRTSWERQVAHGHTFKGTVLNIATQQQLTFRTLPNQPAPTVTITVPDGAGGIENILFLEGGENPQEPHGPNALTALVYATFWIEKVQPPHEHSFMQLQYAQMTVLNFGILTALPNVVILGWPHVSVATLTKGFS